MSMHPDHIRSLWSLVQTLQEFAVFLLGEDGRILTWNAGAEVMFGYGGDEIIGRHISILYIPEDLAKGEPNRELQTARERGRASDDRWLVKKSGNRIWVAGVTVPVHEHEILSGFGKIIRDQTSSRENEERINNLNIALQSKVDELEEFEQVAVGRELRMIDLKRENERLRMKISHLESSMEKRT
ncbi:MAG TPA: PAS domain S-box protein [Nitrospirales bacterium]|nr:PAS domain S-box protein [Nitrospirales bacterium]